MIPGQREGFIGQVWRYSGIPRVECVCGCLNAECMQFASRAEPYGTCRLGYFILPSRFSEIERKLSLIQSPIGHAVIFCYQESLTCQTSERIDVVRQTPVAYFA
jgi:hypothetical protein